MPIEMNHTVYIVDDSPVEVVFLSHLCQSVNLPVETFRSADKFLAQLDPHTTGCLVVDLRMPGSSGLEVLREVRRRKSNLAVVVMSGHADVAVCREALQSGAFDFVEKSFNHQVLLDAIQKAIRHSESKVQQRLTRRVLRNRIASLTTREREVMEWLADGKTLKEIGAGLSISVQTASKHRGRILDKIDVTNEVELVKTLADANLLSA